MFGTHFYNEGLRKLTIAFGQLFNAGRNAIRIDTGDVELDQVFQVKRFMKILQGFRTTRLIRVEES